MPKGQIIGRRALRMRASTAFFGVPGRGDLDVVEACRNSSIKLILTRHEQGAASWPRPTPSDREAGVCLTTLGPGALNLTTGAAYALLGAMPMIIAHGRRAS